MAPKNKIQPTKQVNAPPVKTEAPVMQTSTALVTVTHPTNGALVASAPAWLQAKMKGVEQRGLEVLEKEDLIIPRLVLAQSMSPEVIAGFCRVGDIFDNLSKEVLATSGGELEIIPVVLSKSRMHFQPMKDGGGILCRSDDSLNARLGGDGQDQGGQPTRDCSACVHKEWDDSSEGDDAKPSCTMFYNVVCLVPSRSYLPYVWSTKATQVKVIKRFLSIAKQLRADFFAQKYAIKSNDAQSTNFKFKNYDFRSVGWVTAEEYALGESFYGSMEGKTFKVDTSDIESVGADTSEVEDTPPPPPPTSGRAVSEEDIAF